MSFIEAENPVAANNATERQLRRVIDSALESLGQSIMSDATVKGTFETWLKNKSGAFAGSSLPAYTQAKDLLIEFLGVRADRLEAQRWMGTS